MLGKKGVGGGRWADFATYFFDMVPPPAARHVTSDVSPFLFPVAPALPTPCPRHRRPEFCTAFRSDLLVFCLFVWARGCVARARRMIGGPCAPARLPRKLGADWSNMGKLAHILERSSRDGRSRIARRVHLLEGFHVDIFPCMLGCTYGLHPPSLRLHRDLQRSHCCRAARFLASIPNAHCCANTNCNAPFRNRFRNYRAQPRRSSPARQLKFRPFPVSDTRGGCCGLIPDCAYAVPRNRER